MAETIINKQITEVTPEILAEMFWSMDSEDQAKFYNHLSVVSEFKYPFQLQSITEENGLTLGGRRVMASIGEYSHWGITCNIINDAKNKTIKALEVI